MKTLSLLLMLLAMGCAAPKVERPPAETMLAEMKIAAQVPGAESQVSGGEAKPLAVIAPKPKLMILKVWLTQGGTNFPTTDDWTNQWKFVGAVTTQDLSLPLAQWQMTNVPLQGLNGHLGFTLQSTQAQLFCRSVFQEK